MATIRWLGDGAAIVWIFGGATYFLVHFSLVFYVANKASIDAAASGLSRMLGLDGN